MTLTLSFRIDAGAIAAQDQHSLAVARPDHQAAVYPGTYVLCAYALPQRSHSVFFLCLAYTTSCLFYSTSFKLVYSISMFPIALSTNADTGNDQPTVDTNHLNNFDRKIVTIMEALAGAQLVLAFLRGLINHLSVMLANRQNAAECRNGHDRDWEAGHGHGEDGRGRPGHVGNGIYVHRQDDRQRGGDILLE